MPKAGKFVLVVIIAGFFFGIVQLFLLRFEAGDSYPAYSSLRADPLGARILYDSLRGLAGTTVSRNYQPLLKSVHGAHTTVFLFGVPPLSLNSVSREDARALERIALAGGRLVLLLRPPKETRAHRTEKSGAAGKKKDGEKPDEKKAAGNGSKADVIALGERWKFRISREEFPAGESTPRKMTAAPRQGSRDPAQPLSWHSSLWFEGLSADWRIVYEREEKPVLIERSFGKGTIVIASDSYPVSNEALVKERHPDLLAWLVGGNREVLFEETHLGIHESPGAAALGRKYRLHGLLAGLLAVTALFIWKNTVSLVPPRDSCRQRNDGVRTGRDYLSGLSGLLRRSIPGQDLLAVCVQEWTKTNRQGRDAAGDRARIESIVEAEKLRSARDRDPVTAYRAIQTLLSERKRMS